MALVLIPIFLLHFIFNPIIFLNPMAIKIYILRKSGYIEKSVNEEKKKKILQGKIKTCYKISVHVIKRPPIIIITIIC